MKFPQLRRYLIANSVALHGLWIQRITTAWIAWDLTGSASFVGLVAFFTYIPTMLSGPFFGVMVDRVNAKHAAMATQIALALISFLACILFYSGLLNPVVLCFVAVLIGITASAQHPIRMSFTPRLVPEEHVGSVIVLLSLNFNLARVIGPALGGILIAKAGVGVALLVSAMAYLPVIATISTLIPRPRIRPNTKSTILADFVEGVRFIRASRFIITAISITGLFSLTARGAMEILPTIADGGFGRGATGLGTLTTAAGVGALLATIVQSFMPATRVGQYSTLGLLAAVTGPIFVLLLGSTGNWYVAILFVGMLGFLGTIVGMSMQTSIQLHLTDAMRGRVMSLWIMIALGATATGSIAIGALIDLIGLTLTLQSVGAISGVLISLLIWRR